RASSFESIRAPRCRSIAGSTSWDDRTGPLSSRSAVLDDADDRCEHGPSHAAACNLSDNAADIRRRGAIGEQRNQHAEDLAPDPATDRSGDGVSKRPQIDILGGIGDDVAADRATDDLHNEVDE